MSRVYRQMLLLALVTAIPRVTSAQFTTFMPPKPPISLTPMTRAEVEAPKKPNPDSILSMQLKRMETWVDSAARVPSALRTSTQAPAKRGAAAQLTTTVATASSAPIDTTGLSIPWPRFRNGAPAPATASDLPLFALLGAAMLGAGLLLVGRMPRSEPEPGRARIGPRAADRA